MKIYTKTGDRGKTSLLGNKKVSKANIQIAAYGSVDELNANIGILRCSNLKEQKDILKEIQNILFNIGSILASTPEARKKYKLPIITTANILTLETQIDIITSILPKLKSFILPGSGILNAQCHLARTVCRRAERNVVDLHENSSFEVDIEIIQYLNRLSDYLFTLARFATSINKEEEIKWESK